MPRGVYSIPGRRKAWTPDDDMTLDDLAAQGLSMPQIARRMGRSVNSVDVRSGGRLRGLRPMSARQVAALLGLGGSKTVSRWIAEGWLRGRKLAVGAGAARRWGVSEDALLTFLEDTAHWHRWEADRITDPDIREWALELRAGVRFLTLAEVARRFTVETKTVGQWIDNGYLPAVDNGNRMVRESDLAGFVIPSERPRHRNRYTPAEDRTLVALRDAGHPPDRIAAVVGRPIGSVRKRLWTLSRS